MDGAVGKVNKKRLKIIVICLIAGLLYLGFVLLTGVGIPCPVRTLTGGHIKCPGCGISTMCVALVRFDIPGAIEAHPVIFILLPLWLTAIAFWLFDRYKEFRSVTVKASIAALLVFCVLRNIFRW